MIKCKDFFKAFGCFSSTFQGKFYFQGLFKTVLYIQVLFKPVYSSPAAGETEPAVVAVRTEPVVVG